MRQPLLLQYYHDLPDRKSEDNTRQAAQRIRRGLGRFKKDVETHYNQAALEHLLVSANTEIRQAAVLAMGLTGSMTANAVLATRLHDEDQVVAEMAADALWSLWFRADSREQSRVTTIDAPERQ